jgi:MFS family permease
LALALAEEGGPEVLPSLAAEGGKIPVLSRSFGVASEVKGLLDDCKKLAMNRLYLMNVLGYITFNFVLGAYAYWGPKAGQAIYSMENADLVFGVVTILSGILGTVVGGIFLDYLGSTIRNGFKLLAVSTALGATMCLFAFLSTSLAVFIPLFAIGEFFLFATQGPVNFVTLRCVTPVLRPLSMAMSTVVIHVFGDVPSAPIVGAFQDWLQNWRLTTLGLTCIFFLATAIWASGIATAPRNGDRGIEVTTDLHQPGSKSQEAPLLTNE